MSLTLRSLFNRARRAVAQALLFRIVFGEHRADGLALPLTRISPSTCIEHPQGLTLGNHVFIGHFNYIEALHGVRIDEGVQITNYVSIVSHSSHRSARLMGRAYAVTEPAARVGFIAGPVHIGAYSFIGPHSTLEANTRLGRGCLVASHSRVRGEFADFAVLAGSPAVVIGDTRDDDAPWLADHPEWHEHYVAWAGALPEGARHPSAVPASDGQASRAPAAQHARA
jgi:acetyltransferase-like isoleucine patch superfamily enzyme